MKTWLLYTDGSCDEAGAGGWAYFLKHPDGNSSEAYGASTAKTTSIRMEYCAILGGLLKVPDKQSVIVHTDNETCAQSLSNWWRKWAKNGWTTKEKKPVLNKALIQRILGEMERIGRVQFVHVHRNSIPQMAKVDALSRAGRYMFQEAKKA